MVKDDFREKVTAHMARSTSDIKTLFRDGEKRDDAMKENTKTTTKNIKTITDKQDALFYMMMAAQTFVIGLLVIIFIK